MRKATHRQLLEGLAHYGYPLHEPVPTYEGEELLLKLLRQTDSRLLEGFPVVLLNLLETKKSLEWESPHWDPKRKLTIRERERFSALLSLSYLLFELFGLERTILRRTERILSHLPGGKKEIDVLRAMFQNSAELPLGSGATVSGERLKNTFRNYVLLGTKSEEIKKKRQELELELLLSEFFTPRQKELLVKRQAGETFTKTEREYFSRVIRKRLRALASQELHQFVRSLTLR